MMKGKYYFEHKDSEICYNRSYFEDRMKYDGITEMEVYEAYPDKISGCFWCQVQHFCGDDSRDSCGKQCRDYSPKNGKSGCCRYYSTKLYIHGDKITLKQKT